MTHTLAFTFSWQQLRTVLPIGLVGVLSWSVWLFRFTKSRFYRPLPPGFTSTTSVIVPSYREDPEILDRCLDSWLVENPTEIIIVPDLADTAVIAALKLRTDPRIRVIPFAHQGKRSALSVGIRAATSEILVLSDSDTEWVPGLLANVQAPFKDPKVGGVGTRQNAYQPKSSMWRRVADWMIDVRYLDYVPAQSRAGAVACLSGRTVAYRRSAILPILGHLEHEFFLGKLCDSGDDQRLTWLVLASGYKTVYQSNARTLSMFPNSFRPFMRQRLRWSRNSYRSYVTAGWKGWLWRQPAITQISVLQVSITPLTMGIAMSYLFMSFFRAPSLVTTIALGWLLLGRGIRGMTHLFRRPSDIIVLPLVAVMVIVIALPVKAYALITMNRQGWLTRSSGMIGGEGQSASSLKGAPSNG